MYEIKIYYEDTDAGGVVYYANYLKYFERARTEYFENLGFSVKGLAEKGIHFVVAGVEMDLKAPAVLSDTIEVETKITEVSKVSIVVDYNIRRKIDKKLLVKGRSKMACVDDNFKIRKIPDEIAEKLKKTN